MNAPVRRQPRILASAAVATLVLLVHLPVAMLDPARGVTFSNAPFSDEAWNLIGARSLALFGHPPTDEWQTWLLTLPFTAVQAAAFSVFGVDLGVARMVVIGSVAATGAVVTYALSALAGLRPASIAGLAAVTSGLTLYYGRLAFLEPVVAALLSLGVLSLAPALSARPARWGVAGGVVLALAVMTKGHAVAAVIGIVGVATVAALASPPVRRWLIGAVSAGGIVAAAWGGFVLVPRMDDVLMVVREIYPRYQWPRDVGTLANNMMSYPFGDQTFVLAWPVMLLGVAGVVWLGMRRRGMWRVGDVVPAAAATGWALGMLLLSIPDYNANRYAVAFIPLAAIAGAWALPRALTSRWIPTIAVAVVVVLPGLALHVEWVRRGGDEVQRIQATAGRTVEAGAVVVGQYAPLVALGLPVRTIVPFRGTINEGDWYGSGARYVTWPSDPITDLLVPEPAWLERTELGCFQWGRHDTRTCLVRVP